MSARRSDMEVTISGWPTFPIHPKLACLFLKGKTIREAFLIMVTIANSLPPDILPRAEPWIETMCVAATWEKDSNPPQSLLSIPWEREDHLTNETSAKWYHALVDTWAPVTTKSCFPFSQQATGGTDFSLRETATGATSQVPTGRDTDSLGTTSRRGVTHTGGAAPQDAASFPFAGLETFFDALTDKLTASPFQRAQSAKRFEWHELEYVFHRTGVQQTTPGSYTGLG